MEWVSRLRSASKLVYTSLFGPWEAQNRLRPQDLVQTLSSSIWRPGAGLGGDLMIKTQREHRPLRHLLLRPSLPLGQKHWNVYFFFYIQYGHYHFFLGDINKCNPQKIRLNTKTRICSFVQLFMFQLVSNKNRTHWYMRFYLMLSAKITWCDKRVMQLQYLLVALDKNT